MWRELLFDEVVFRDRLVLLMLLLTAEVMYCYSSSLFLEYLLLKVMVPSN